MDLRRIRLLGLLISRLRYVLYLLSIGKFKMAYNHLWVGAFSYDAGIALLDPFYRRFPFLVPLPRTIEIEVTTRCHLKCVFCEQTYWHEPPRDMSFEQFKNIVDQLPLKWVGTIGIGTAFLNKDYMKMLEYLKSKDIFVELYDTFDLIDDKTLEKLVSLKIDKISISMDAATKSTYEKIRVGANFDRVLRNIRKFVEFKKMQKSPLPELWFHYVVTNVNIDEVLPFVDLVRELTNNSNYATLINWSNALSFDETKPIQLNIPGDLREKIVEKAHKLGLFVNWNLNTVDFECRYTIDRCLKWTNPLVLVTGHLMPCCITSEANARDHQKKYSLGNVFEKSFAEIWKSKEFYEFRKKLLEGKLPAICKNCRVYKIK